MIPDDFKARPRSGYRRGSPAFDRAFNLGFALLLLIPASPVLLLLSFLLLIRDGRPVFYKSVRLGLNKRLFTMHKFRTLIRDADRIVGPQLLTCRHRLTTPHGRLLRDTRLDELPQLLNVVKGDMDLVGPRPERPEIYENICRHIPGYDRRFKVKPGLIGYAQLFTPHSTPKKMRAYIDNKLMRRPRALLWDVYTVFFTTFVIVGKTATGTLRYLNHTWVRTRLLGRQRERRALERVRLRNARVLCEANPDPRRLREVGVLVDINEQAFLLHSEQALGDPFPRRFTLETGLDGWRKRGKRRRAVCEGELYRSTPSSLGGHDYVVMYRPVSPLNYYMVRQYFLKESVA